MSDAQINWFESAPEWLSDGTFDLNSNTFKTTLHTSMYLPDSVTQSVYADLTNELPTANGYTNGGQTLTGVAWTRAGLTDKFSSNAPVWNASGGPITARYAVIRAVGTLNGRVDPVIAYILLDSTPADVTATDGNTFTITPNASNGWFKQTAANA